MPAWLLAPPRTLAVQPRPLLLPPPNIQAFIDVAHAGKGPGATELREPLAAAFEAGFFEDKASFD